MTENQADFYKKMNTLLREEKEELYQVIKTQEKLIALKDEETKKLYNQIEELEQKINQ